MFNSLLSRSPRSKTPLKSINLRPQLQTDASPSSLYDQMWAATTLYQQTALHSDFIQGIAHCTLDPDQYGQFTVLDAAYCSYSVADYDIVIPKAQNPEIKSFCEARQKDYENYNAEVFAGWHIKDPAGIKLTSIAQQYASFERYVAEELDPLYFIVAMTPCISLWTYIGVSLNHYATPQNLYSSWIKANQVVDAPKSMADFINAHANEMNQQLAIDIFSKCMQFECNMFLSACNQPPV
ncbi:thiaminase (transcriptional activator TenA) [Oceanospirillum multiglobuliferum]|uniref:Thiaminase-2/PQQC domain-containing protein n=1 Tax=Oceanospirillum multiglobuliferum TaxID=64969 RepID=A0A1T4QWI4_9GAMM|nr:hypothetical protein [Oceanospirillum multiglobuliferum]OPX57089.1 hypothetical protein BTE48_01275 [Oceanospirillum multiglobuliferum]SKA08074.1 thiaminase (transcriptional activator TenA) [Oceanospirillum multiglobuliferum]